MENILSEEAGKVIECIGKYKEFGFDSGVSIRACFDEKPYLGKDKIVDYLRNGGNVFCCAPSVMRDCITGKPISEEQVTRYDEKYKWPSYLAHYVDRYNLRLPIAFEKHILSLAD